MISISYWHRIRLIAPFNPKILFQKKAVEPDGITNGSRIEKNNIKKFLPVFFKKIASVKDNITVEAKAIIEKIRKFLTPN